MHYHNTKKKQKQKTSSSSSSYLSQFVKVPTDTLLIVESPAKCSTIEKHLGPGYRCIATMGHVRYLDGLDSIDINNNYKLNFKIMESKKSQIKKIQAEIKMSAKIVIATDDDREGESIAWHICELFHLPIDKTERIIFHEITKDVLQHAVKHPKRVNMSIVHSAHARQILDLLIGYKISPFLWKHIASDGATTLSAGRCQTPALRIIYENELERIERLNEKSLNENSYFYSVIGFFTRFNLPFSLTASFETQNKNRIDCFLKASTHENAQFIYKRVSQKPSAHVTKAPEPFTTSRLQQVASNEFAFSPSETMEICQTLYERGYITYIRTTGKSYSADFINGHIVPFIQEKWGSEYANLELPMCIENDTASAHEAIRPTDIMRFGLTGDYHAREQKMYKLIWRNTVESCMSDYTFSSLETAVETNILTQEREQVVQESKNEIPEFYTFLHTCHKPIFYGWKIVQGLTVEQREHGAMEYLLNMRNLSQVSCNKIETKVVFSSSSLPSHYTEARLIQSLEEKEIGRPSTFSTIIEKIKKREYVKKQNIQGESIECVEHVVSFPEKKISQIVVQREFGTEKNKLCITSLGKSVCSFLISHFPHIFSYEYTNRMEADLDDIARPTMESSPNPFEKLKRVCDACFREIGENIHKYNSEHTEKKENSEKIIIKNNDDTISTSNLPLLNAKCGEYVIGTYGGFEIVLKNGRFGNYVVWGKDGMHRKSIEKTHLQIKDLSSISLDEIVRFIENDLDNVVVTATSAGGEGILRIINDDVSIRSGKYGNYIFYKTMHMKKPKFVSLKDFQKNIYTCSDADLLSIIR
jgi:DNA topoisomerase-1